MERIIQKAEELKATIKRREKEIDNPVMVMSILCELENLIEYMKDET